jgi:magnesium-transporting ATPase (P-type)
VNFEDPSFWQDFKPGTKNYPYIVDMLLHLALCHTIVIDERTGKYNASSPDELALVNAAKFFGAEFVKRDEENNMIINFEGKQLSYRLMNILEFNSTRKRMSVIVEDPQGEYILLTKGADSIIKERLNMHASPFFRDSQISVDAFAEEGLRTLFLAKRKLSKNEYLEWNAKYEAAMQTISNRDEEVAAVNEQIEVKLELVGSTAIEDKLQEGVRKVSIVSLVQRTQSSSFEMQASRCGFSQVTRLRLPSTSATHRHYLTARCSNIT